MATRETNIRNCASNRFIIITVPHHTCPNEDKQPSPLAQLRGEIRRHPCDFGAKYLALPLYQALIDSKAFGPDRVALFLGDVPRTTCDLNRPECRDTPFRQKLSDKLMDFLHRASKSGGEVVLLDLHSFPTRQDWDDLALDADLVVLYLDVFCRSTLECWPTSQREDAIELGHVLTHGEEEDEDAIRMVAIRGSVMNDILYEALANGVLRTHLIEVGEFLTLGQLEVVLRALVHWLIYSPCRINAPM